jgi:large subunit ribosomal protein L19
MAEHVSQAHRGGSCIVGVCNISFSEFFSFSSLSALFPFPAFCYSLAALSQTLLTTQAKIYKRTFPDLRPGYTVRVHQKIQEGGKERIQIFEGLVISVHKGRVLADATFTVRRVVEGIGVEKIFSLCSPNIAKIDVVKVAKVRRAKLFFLRGRKGKATRLNERFTTADEFTVAVNQSEPQLASPQTDDSSGELQHEEVAEEEAEQ